MAKAKKAGGQSPKPLVLILLGSKNDQPTALAAIDKLDKLGIPFAIHVASAHRTPERMRKFARAAYIKYGVRVAICIAGGSAHLQAMTEAFAHPLVTVFGVGVPSSDPVSTLAAIFSNVVLPMGCSVPFFGAGKGAPVNAALAAAKNLAIDHPAIRAALLKWYEDQEREVAASQAGVLRDIAQHRAGRKGGDPIMQPAGGEPPPRNHK